MKSVFTGLILLFLLGLGIPIPSSWAMTEPMQMKEPEPRRPHVEKLEPYDIQKRQAQHPQVHPETREIEQPTMTDPSYGNHPGSPPRSSIIINVPARTLMLFVDDTLVKEYPIAVGMPQHPSPLGSYEVISMVEHPNWENPYKPEGYSLIPAGKDNPLGPRWIGFKADNGGEYGIHGTNQPESIGKFISHGCIRMHNADIEELFQQVELGTPVQLVYALAVLEQKENGITLSHYPDRYNLGKVGEEQVLQQLKAAYPDARVDLKALRTTLAKPTEKPSIIGQLPPPSPVAQAQPQNKQATKLTEGTASNGIDAFLETQDGIKTAQEE